VDSRDTERGRAPWAIDPAQLPEGFVAFPPVAVETSIPARFFEVAATHPDRPALSDATGVATYAEVAQRVHRLARSLVEVLRVPQGVVALLLDHDATLVTALFGVLSAGCTVVVLDPLSPPEVSKAILADAAPVALVHSEAHADLAASVATGAVVLHGLDEVEAAAPEGTGGPWTTPVPIAAGDAAMLAYTSGTTGDAKAAAMSHRALLHLMRGATDALAIAPSDRLPMLFPVSMAVAAYPMMLPLVNGAALCTYDMRALGLAPFPAWLVEQAITVIYFSPTVARFMGDGASGTSFDALRLVVLGGERVDDDAIAVVRRQFGSDTVVANGYGLTETGVLTFFFTDAATTYGAAGVPVGHPIPGVELRVLDDDLAEVVPGEIGDLYVRSRYLFDGYLGRPRETDRVLNRRPGHVASDYRTGDIGRIDGSGCLELTGRSDTAVKVRGHRVVPGEVEAALLALPEVKDAVVEARPDPMGSNALVAWVVPAGDWRRVTSVDVRGALAATVKAYLVPTDIMVLDELPVLPNGKLDRRALPQPGAGRMLPASDYLPPRDDLERDLARIWEAVLDVHPIGIRDDFFDLGGDSLGASRALIVIEEDRGVHVPMATLIDVRCIADLAEVVRRLEAPTGGPPPRTSTVVPVQEGDPARPRLFFVHDLYGTAWVLRPLAAELGTDQPVSGFESPLLRGPLSPFRDLEAMAMRYVADLRLEQAAGPYHLAGYSFGGVLAFEMARQLVEEGDEVAFLGIIDVGPGYRGRHYDPRKVLDKPWLYVRRPPPAGTPWRERLRFYRSLAAYPDEVADHLLLRTGLDRWTDPIRFRRDIRRTGQIHPGHRTWYAWRAHWQLARTYRWKPRSYPGDLTLFWAEESAATDGTMGWRDVVTGSIDIVRLDVPHEQMMHPDAVAAVGPPLREALDHAIGRRTSPGAAS